MLSINGASVRLEMAQAASQAEKDDVVEDSEDEESCDEDSEDEQPDDEDSDEENGGEVQEDEGKDGAYTTISTMTAAAIALTALAF